MSDIASTLVYHRILALGGRNSCQEAVSLWCYRAGLMWGLGAYLYEQDVFAFERGE